MTLRAIIKEALANVAMECGPFTAAELVEFEKIDVGTKTTEQYRSDILNEIRQESHKKRRKQCKTV